MTAPATTFDETGAPPLRQKNCCCPSGSQSESAAVGEPDTGTFTWIEPGVNFPCSSKNAKSGA